MDCLIIGAGPAGLTAATYLLRYRRKIAVIDNRLSRASRIPMSYNYPAFPEGIPGEELLLRMRTQAERYGAVLKTDTVNRLERLEKGGFRAETDNDEIRADMVILATGCVDIEPPLPNLSEAVHKGFIHHCPICDAYELIDKRVAVLGVSKRCLAEALFIRRYTENVTILSLGTDLALTEEEQNKLLKANIRLIEAPIERVDVEANRISRLHAANGEAYAFEALYSAMGTRQRSELALNLGADHDQEGALIVDAHQRSSVPGLYVIGDVVSALNQISVAQGQAAIAATHLHNSLR